MGQDKAHWRAQKERASGFWQMKFMLGTYRLFGTKRLRVIIYPIVFCFYAFAPKVRKLSRKFLTRAAIHAGKPLPSRMDPFRHVVSFAYSMIEKIAAWSGDVDLDRINFHEDDVRSLIARLEDGKGAVVICSHVGNMELLRALATHDKTRVSRKFMVTSIVDFSGTAKFNRLIEEISPESMMHLVSAKDMGVDTVLDLHARLERGELLVIAGDRTSSTAPDKVEEVSFLGEDAEFPQGAFILASLMDAPVYFMFGVREDDLDPVSPYDLRVFKAATEFTGSRKERRAKIRAIVTEYVLLLERFVGEHPLQWYNFYDFWNKAKENKENKKK
ncbi:MAG TPA: hypothetical protein PKO22_08865 [Treponemataceae bacterium]|nr:hypothetical protein [Treponemataceae bacterium]